MYRGKQINSFWALRANDMKSWICGFNLFTWQQAISTGQTINNSHEIKETTAQPKCRSGCQLQHSETLMMKIRTCTCSILTTNLVDSFQNLHSCWFRLEEKHENTCSKCFADSTVLSLSNRRKIWSSCFLFFTFECFTWRFCVFWSRGNHWVNVCLPVF